MEEEDKIDFISVENMGTMYGYITHRMPLYPGVYIAVGDNGTERVCFEGSSEALPPTWFPTRKDL